MLVVAVVSVDAYPFLAFSNLTSRLEDTGTDVSWLHSVELGSSNQEQVKMSG